MNFIKLYFSLWAFLLTQFSGGIAQEYQLKKDISPEEKLFLMEVIQEISEKDHLYRGKISNGTLDENIIAQMDSAYEAGGVEAYFKYKQSLNLSLDKTIKDSLWQLQHRIDYENHLCLRGIFDTYGFLPKEFLGKLDYVPILILMHPPKDWDIPQYLEDYSKLLKPEVIAGRMPAKTYATFVDNIKGKILRQPQLYGTNMQYDSKTQKVLPPIIADLQESNAARQEIGLPLLKSGEYRLFKN